MATRSVSAAHSDGAKVDKIPSTAQDERFHKLLDRLLDLLHHFMLVDQRLFDFQGIPEELQPAASVLHDATSALDSLYNDLDGWHVGEVAAWHDVGEVAAWHDVGEVAAWHDVGEVAAPGKPVPAAEAQPLPSREFLDRMISTHQRTLYSAATIIRQAEQALLERASPIDAHIDDDVATEVRYVLHGAQKLIDETTSELELRVLERDAMQLGKVEVQ